MTDAAWGRMIAGRYRLDKPLGQGGMGEVWAGYDTVLDRRVAVKLMKQPSPSGSALMEDQEIARLRFLREVRTTAALDSLGIPAVHDAGQEPDTGELYVVMQLLAGAELADEISAHDYQDYPPSVAWAAAIGAQIAATLVEVHRVSVVHRDIKPRNVYITPGGIVKVLDFGIARLLGGGAVPELTLAGQTVGTPPYMSPEQCLSNGVGPPADIYSLGCVLHELLTGRLPFEETPTQSVLHQHVHASATPVSDLRPGVPPPIVRLVSAMLAKPPEKRPDAAAVYEVLLPYAREGGDGASRDDLDPALPFVRPMAAAPRKRVAPSPAPSRDVRPLTAEEADRAMEEAQRLVADDQFSQAVDVLTAAIERSGHDALLAAEVRFGLANVLFLADSHRRALAEFEAAEPTFLATYGEMDRAVLDCRYYMATCRAALGEDTTALASFADLLSHWVPAGPEDGRAEDMRKQVGVLHARGGRVREAMTTFEELRPAIVLRYGESSPEVREVDAYIAKLREYED
ncbi:protein kinase [Actinomadura luteofluorescens]|uniref:protein kinase domain-containing protein n=1 Tax=Actinomadura luteofluorescens TaxID=46163 RepID=UPI003493E68A